MEHECFEYKIVMDDGSDMEVLARLASLDLASAGDLAAVAKYPNRNAYLRQGARIIKQNPGEPKEPAAEPDPNLKSWSAHLIGGKKMALLGYLEAVSEAAAIEQAVALYRLVDERRERLAVNPRTVVGRSIQHERPNRGRSPRQPASRWRVHEIPHNTLQEPRLGAQRTRTVHS
jgi:hypothetical protein